MHDANQPISLKREKNAVAAPENKSRKKVLRLSLLSSGAILLLIVAVMFALTFSTTFMSKKVHAAPAGNVLQFNFKGSVTEGPSAGTTVAGTLTIKAPAADGTFTGYFAQKWTGSIPFNAAVAGILSGDTIRVAISLGEGKPAVFGTGEADGNGGFSGPFTGPAAGDKGTWTATPTQYTPSPIAGTYVYQVTTKSQNTGIIEPVQGTLGLVVDETGGIFDSVFLVTKGDPFKGVQAPYDYGILLVNSPTSQTLYATFYGQTKWGQGITLSFNVNGSVQNGFKGRYQISRAGFATFDYGDVEMVPGGTFPTSTATASDFAFNGTVNEGPSAGTAVGGTLTVNTPGNKGGFVGSLDQNGQKTPVVGILDGSKLYVVISLGNDLYVFGSGASDKQGGFAGPFTGPADGDKGTWTATVPQVPTQTYSYYVTTQATSGKGQHTVSGRFTLIIKNDTDLSATNIFFSQGDDVSGTEGDYASGTASNGNIDIVLKGVGKSDNAYTLKLTGTGTFATGYKGSYELLRGDAKEVGTFTTPAVFK